MSDAANPYPAQNQYPASPEYGQPPAAGPQPKRKVWIIVLVVAVLLLTCCCLATAGTVYFISSSEDPETSGEADPRMAEWDTIRYYDAEMLPVASPEQEALAAEALAQITPGATFVEGRVAPGWIEENDDGTLRYQGELVCMLVTTPGGGQVVADVYLQNEQMKSEGLSFTGRTEPDYPMFMTLTLSDGTEAYSTRSWDSGAVPFGSDAHEALAAQTAEDWPGGTLCYMNPRDDGSDTVLVSVTTWSAFAIAETSPTMWATYEPDGEGWSLVNWQTGIAHPSEAPEL